MKTHLLRLRSHQMVDDVTGTETRFNADTSPIIIRMGTFTIGWVNLHLDG